MNSPHRAKKIEDIGTIINRVVRAGCCLEPQQPEDVGVMINMLGDGSDYYH